MITKKQLSLLLSRLLPPPSAKADLEQYQTPSEIAGDVLWMAYISGDIEGKKVIDLGCGNGILGCGSLILGAENVIFLDADENAIKTAKKNVSLLEAQLGRKLSCSFVKEDAADFVDSADCIVENPPFGVQQEHADRNFLITAMKSKVIYSLHKLETKDFIEKFVRDNGKKATLLKKYSFPLKKSMSFHKKRVYKVDVGLWRIC